ncbi:MAG: GGDEF domain-containing protein [Oscillospiraceae bacterium]|nr:GGDEF domain-containing protein [Oscillospiraceae bacterium]
MNNDVLIAFSVFQIVFLMLDLFILTNTGRNIARKGEYTWFYFLIVTHMVYLLLNNLWTMSEYHLVKLPRSAILVVCTISLWTVTVCATAFFMFTVEKLNMQRLRYGAGRWLSWLPAAFSTLMITSSAWTGLVFYLDEKGSFIHGPMYLPVLASVSLYLLIIAAVSFVNIFRGKTRLLRKANATMFFSVLIIIAFVVADGFLAKASILPAAIFSVIAGIFITMQVANINSDALTGMNNRSKAEEYLSDRIKNVSEKKPIFLYMGDLNNFKKINDTYGHAVGDEALILCSQALKRTIDRYGGFAARYGGDEFLISWQPDKDTEPDPDALAREVNTFLQELSSDKPYKLAMTTGYVCCTNPKEPLISYIRQADSMLYQRKRAASIGR